MITIEAATISATPSIGRLARLRSSTSVHISSITAPMTTEPTAFRPSTTQPNGLRRRRLGVDGRRSGHAARGFGVDVPPRPPAPAGPWRRTQSSLSQSRAGFTPRARSASM